MDTRDLENYRKIRVENIGLTYHLVNLLLENNIRSVGGIINRSERELKNLLKISYGEIRNIYKKVQTLDNQIEEKQDDSISQYRTPVEVEFIPPKLRILTDFDAEEEDIIEFMANALGYKKTEIEAHTRSAEVVAARDLIIYALREYGGLSYPAIGELIDRDHTTIIHAYRKIKHRFEYDPDQESELVGLIDKVKSIKNRKLKIEKDIIPVIIASVKKEKKRSVFKDIPKRNLKILELYREGLTLENISKVFGLTRERVRQVSINTIRQQAINESVLRGIIIDSEVMMEEEAKKRRVVREAKRPQKSVKKEKGVRWSRFYLACRSCGTINIPHVRHGYCESCLGMIRGKRRDDIIYQHQNKCDTCGISRGEAIRQYGRDFYITKSQKVLCRKDFLELTGKALGGRIREKKQ